MRLLKIKPAVILVPAGGFNMACSRASFRSTAVSALLQWRKPRRSITISETIAEGVKDVVDGHVSDNKSVYLDVQI